MSKEYDEEVTAKDYYYKYIFPELKKRGLDVETRYQKFVNENDLYAESHFTQIGLHDFLHGRTNAGNADNTFYDYLREWRSDIHLNENSIEKMKIMSAIDLRNSNSMDLEVCHRVILGSVDVEKIRSIIKGIFIYKHGSLGRTAIALLNNIQNIGGVSINGGLVRFDTGLMEFFHVIVILYLDFLDIAVLDVDDERRLQLIEKGVVDGEKLLLLLDIWLKDIVREAGEIVSLTTLDATTPIPDRENAYETITDYRFEIEKFVTAHEIGHHCQEFIAQIFNKYQIEQFSTYKEATTRHKKEYEADIFALLLSCGKLNSNQSNMNHYSSGARGCFLYFASIALLNDDASEDFETHPSILNRFLFCKQVYEHLLTNHTSDLSDLFSGIMALGMVDLSIQFIMHLDFITRGKGLGRYKNIIVGS